jgi:hypothetical protein
MTPKAQIEMLTAEKDELVRERQSLRDGGANGDELERNRLRIIDTQWQLSHAFVEAHSAVR